MSRSRLMRSLTRAVVALLAVPAAAAASPPLTAFLGNGYHLQDEAFLSWFAREVPSTAVGGMYGLFGTLTTVPPVCSSAATAMVPARSSSGMSVRRAALSRR